EPTAPRSSTWVGGVYEKNARVSMCHGKRLYSLDEYMRDFPALRIVWSSTGNNHNEITMLINSITSDNIMTFLWQTDRGRLYPSKDR
ncbi:MAG: hypothetical protein KAV87_47490, partial [Desulfobacteraceae bacterium]|nr:hypothetical protein [Desulfobacteraceae bacterium]